uniref:Secreted protein n=1 Tax=Acrobeloides nanus TaxID=290746 RepID=A0A914CQI9_9BILA
MRTQAALRYRKKRIVHFLCGICFLFFCEQAEPIRNLSLRIFWKCSTSHAFSRLRYYKFSCGEAFRFALVSERSVHIVQRIREPTNMMVKLSQILI